MSDTCRGVHGRQCSAEHLFVRGGVNEVSASEVTGNKLTIGNPMEGHTYKVYQIFKGDVSTGDPDSIKLSNVEYGKNYTGSGEAEMTAAKEAEALAESVDGLGESKAAKEFAKKVRSQIESDTASEDQKAAFVVLDSGNQYSAGVEPGYYLVVDESNREDVTNDVISDYIVGIIGKDVTVQPKAVTVPDFDKSIDKDAAAETPKKQTTLTITNPEDGYTYKVYQIFKGDVEDGKLVNPEYGANYNGSGNLESDVAALNGAADKKEYAVSIKDTVNGDPVAVLDKNNPSVTVDGGFFVIIVEDKDGNEAADGTVADGKDKDTEVNPHIHSYTSTVTKTATCTEKGIRIFTCECGDSYTEEIPMTEHSYADNPSEYNHVCQKCGNQEVHNFVDHICTVCGARESITGCCPTPLSANVNTADWNYTLNKDTKTITLNYYNFNTDNTEVIVYGSYKVEGDETEYKTKLKSNTQFSGNKYMFSRYNDIQSIVFNEDVDTSTCTGMASMFGYCRALKNLDISHFDTSNVKDMASMFYDCRSLTSLNLSNFDTCNVTDMSGMFNGCMALTNLEINNFDTSNVTTMSIMFCNCNNLTDLNISGFDTSKVTNMYGMFSQCRKLKSILVGKKWTMKNVGAEDEYRGRMFEGCGTSNVTVISSSSILPLSLFSHAFASELGDTATPAAIEIDGEDKTVDYAPGDEVPFKLEATMPESISAYEKYKLVFHDKIVSGLEYLPGSVEVYVDGNKIDASKYTVTPEDMSGDTLTVAIDDVKAEPWNAVAGSKVVVKYRTKMTEQGADLGAKNEAFLEYSNDPNGTGTGTTGDGSDDKDVVEVVTFDLEFHKVDKAGDDLDGAGFTLYMEDPEAEGADDDGYVTVNRWNINDDDVDGVARFCFNGLKPGNYKLVESRTPDGYNTMEDLIFSIAKDVDEETGIITIRLLKDGVPMEGWTVSTEEVSKKDGDVTYTRTKYTFDGKIVNFSGSELPSTGGMGTYLFYIAGAALVILIGAVMVARRKETED